MALLSRRHRRWAVPFAALATFSGIGIVGNLVPAGADVPDLPKLTPAELVAKARAAHVDALSGTIELTSNLGLPAVGALSGSVGGSSTTTLTSLLAGTHAADVWFDGPDHVRVATAKPLAETNWIRNGEDLWSYDSVTRRATHATMPADQVDAPEAADVPDAAEGPETTPAQLAQRLLDDVTPSTEVRVDTPRYVDGRPVYELVLSPKASASTVADAVISVDAATGLPLAVRIDAKHGSDPAFRLAFSHIRLKRPAASMFDFSPPPGATVVQAGSAGELINPVQRDRGDREEHHHGDAPAPSTPEPGSSSTPTTVGEDWTTVAIIAASSVPSQARQLFGAIPLTTIGGQRGRLVTTALVNAILLPDGRLVVGAVTPDALVAALPG
jgi:outer membrane lipoprotein-sorting protein